MVWNGKKCEVAHMERVGLYNNVLIVEKMRTIWVFLTVMISLGCLQAEGRVESSTITLPSAIITSSASSSLTTTSMIDDYAFSIPTTLGMDKYGSTLTEASTISVPITSITLNPLIRTFTNRGRVVCRIDGKPVIRMFSRSDCEHCKWSGPIFDKVAKEYADRGLIVAYHWVFDTNDDTLTSEAESDIPTGEYKVFMEGKSTTVPYFDFGCRFTRIGNGYYVRDMKDAEETEYRAVIEQLIKG
jgi:thiol-disulfide isomerase/thioredoxin